jgi:FMN-dependent NADH-azoreductase
VRIVSFNGSPRGGAGNTQVMIDALLKGMRSEDSEITQVCLAENNIGYCAGCHCCWTRTPGRCAIDDDMKELLPLINGADIVILGSPLYFCAISGTLKVFIDRLTALGGDPRKATSGEPRAPSYLVMLSNCGFPDGRQFEATSTWIRAMSGMLGMGLLGEFYATNGKVLTSPAHEREQNRIAYLEYLENCGKSYLMRGESIDRPIKPTPRDIRDL